MEQEVFSMHTIAIVDDNPYDLKLLGKILRNQHYRVYSFPNGELALKGMEKGVPDLILLDIKMPDMNGFELSRKLQENPLFKDIPVIFLSALHDTEDKVTAFSVGGVDYITKPFSFEEVLARVKIHLRLRQMQKTLDNYNKELEKQVKKKVQEILDTQASAVIALVKLAEERDGDTGKHLERVRLYCHNLAEALRRVPHYAEKIDDFFIENISLASTLHDIGKLGIKDQILTKPDRLSPEEYEDVKKHTLIGSRTLQSIREVYPNKAFINMGIEIARSHHEWWNGKGYPDGLIGEAIPLSARIMAIVDVYDALRMERCYKPAFSQDKAMTIIRKGRGTQFDPIITDVFMGMEDVLQQIVEKFSQE